jgi:hypothetical protein
MESIIESFKTLTSADQKKTYTAIIKIMDDKPKRVRKSKSADDGEKEAKEPTEWMKEIAAVREEYLIKDKDDNVVLKAGKPTYSISYKEAMSMASARKAAADPEYAVKKAALKAKYKEKSEKTVVEKSVGEKKEKGKGKGKKSPSSESAFADSEPEQSETEQSDSGLPKASKPKVKKVAKLPKVKESKKE